MDISKLDFKTILKYGAVGILALFVLAFVVQIVGSATFLTKGVENLAYEESGYGEVPGAHPSVGSYAAKDGVMLSSRNVEDYLPPVPDGEFSPGSDAEDFEIKEYSADIRTGDLEGTCSAIEDLKSRDYVIFENSNEYDRGCSYTFKVEKDRTDEVLAILEGLDPENLSESTYTIKKRIEDFTSQTEILEKKLASINETLDSALEAYDEITGVATRTQNAEALAKIIDSKIGIIERLTQERINVTSQLERLERAKSEQLDRLEYTYFYTHVTEDKYVDGDSVRDSWKAAVKQFVRNVNEAIQGITIDLLGLLVLIIQYVIYAFILVIVAKYGWVVVKRIWKK